MAITRANPDELAIAMLDGGSSLIAVARRVSALGLPVLGGVAVFLHGYRRTTDDLDVFAGDTEAARAAIESLGGVWDPRAREFVIEGVPVQLVTAEQTGEPPRHISEIDGIRVVSLADLIRFKLRAGLSTPGRTRDLADVEELVRRVPLDKAFAAKLPTEQRAAFKKMVDAVHPGGTPSND